MFVKKDTKVINHHQFWKKLTKKQIKLRFYYKDLPAYLWNKKVVLYVNEQASHYNGLIKR